MTFGTMMRRGTGDMISIARGREKETKMKNAKHIAAMSYAATTAEQDAAHNRARGFTPADPIYLDVCAIASADSANRIGLDVRLEGESLWAYSLVYRMVYRHSERVPEMPGHTILLCCGCVTVERDRDPYPGKPARCRTHGPTYMIRCPRPTAAVAA